MHVPEIDLFFSTKNKGKFMMLKKYLDDEVSLKWWRTEQLLLEGDDTMKNAELKSLLPSKNSKGFFLGNDDSLKIHADKKSTITTTSIYRNIPNVRNEKDVINYYHKYLLGFGKIVYPAEIISAYVLSTNGIVLGRKVISYKLELKIPPKKRVVPGMPLSAFHFIPNMDKYFVDLANSEKKKVVNKQLLGLRSFILETAKSYLCR